MATIAPRGAGRPVVQTVPTQPQISPQLPIGPTGSPRQAPIPSRGRGALPTGTQPQPSGSSGSTTTSLPGSTTDPTAATMGQPMYPWLMPWQGPYAATMSPYESQSLQGLSDYANQDFGMGGAQDYLQNVMSGQYLDVANNPNFRQIQSAEDQLLQTQQSRALQELQSRAAAGGNALSGGLMQQESDYLRNSNAGLQSLMGQLMAQQYGQERGLQSQAASQTGQLAQVPLAGYGELAALGQVPRDIAQRELTGQYQDFLRQGGALRDQFQYPDYLSLQTLARGYPANRATAYGTSGAQDLINLLGMMGQGGGSGGIMDFINGLLSSGGTTDTTGGGDPTAAADGVPVHYDATPAQSQKAQYQAWLASMGAGSTQGAQGPMNYQDRLTQEIQQSQNPPGSQASGATKAMDILALLSMLFGMGGQKKSGSKGVSGGSSSLGQKAGSGLADVLKGIFNKPGNPSKGTAPPTDESPGGGIPQSVWDTYNAGNFDPGSQGFDQTLTQDINDNPWFYQSNNDLPSIPFSGNDFGNFSGSDFSGSGGGGGNDFISWDTPYDSSPVDYGGGSYGD